MTKIEQTEYSDFHTLLFFVSCVSPGMSLLSNPRKLQCCSCWRNGVPPTWLLCLGMIVVQVSLSRIINTLIVDDKDSVYGYYLFIIYTV